MKKKNNTKKKVSILGLITARGGSKGVPGKNIKELGGKPLIAYTIEAAIASGVFDRIVLSTDDEAIARVGKKYGAEVPFMRPAELAEDGTKSLPVVIHALVWLRDNHQYVPEYTVILQPTSPFRQPFHIEEAVDLVQKTKANSVLAVSHVPEQFNPLRTMVRQDHGGLMLSHGKPVRERIARRQDLPDAFWNTTALYVFQTKLLFESNPNFFGDIVMPYVMDEKYTLDINDMSDWKKAEELIETIDEWGKR